ncbi:MAG TPA: hypothetical protein VK157_03655 [Phycisphaerales bacterium]|nr:hypothetical protein [Phycisphaerales bacterium]
MKTIDRTMDRDDVVPVIVIQCPRLRTPPEPSQSLDEMVRMLMSPSDVDPPAVYLVPAYRFRDQIVQQIDGICTMFSSQFTGWSIGVQPVPSSHPDFGNPPVVIYPSSVGCDN